MSRAPVRLGAASSFLLEIAPEVEHYELAVRAGADGGGAAGGGPVSGGAAGGGEAAGAGPGAGSG